MMGSTGRNSILKRRTIESGLLALALFLTALTASAQAAAPTHVHREAFDVTGLNHACGAAVDSQGDLYLSSAGESKVKVYSPSHSFITQIEDANTPCGLAVTTTGVLYVSERATGKVVGFKPNKYPFSGTPTYGAPETIDASGNAKGIATDPFDDALYVAEGNRVSAYVHELQTVSLNGAVTGGSFKLKFEGQETGSLKFDASDKEVKEALEALTTIEAGNVEVVKYAGSGVTFASYAVFFTGKFAYTDVSTMGGVNELTGTENPRVSVFETAKGFSGQIGEGTLSEASGVAAYTAEGEESKYEHYLWVADAKGVGADSLILFRGETTSALKLRGELNGSTTPDGSFGFGAAGANLAADPGTVKVKKCVTVGEEACTAGHIFLYDATHKALDEFDGFGEYLDQVKNAAFADAEPSAVAIDRSGGSNDGTLYVTAGAGAGGEALAFRPLGQPGRETLAEPISKALATAGAVATDRFGDVYAAAGTAVSVYDPKGTKLASFTDSSKPSDLAVDSTCHLYVLDGETKVTYYTPSESKCPPVSGTTYTRHEPVIVKAEEFPTGSKSLKAIAVNPGPSSGKDHLFVTGNKVTREYDSVEHGSTLLKSEFGKELTSPFNLREALAVNGANGNVYIGTNPRLIYVINSAGTEVLTRVDASISTTGKTSFSPHLAVDQTNGHVVEFDGKQKTAHEYEAATGGFVAEFGNFTQELTVPYRVAIDNACALHEPKLTGSACEAFDPANGNVYVAFDDTSESHPPFDVTAFGPLKYPQPVTPVKKKLTVKETGTGSGKIKTSDLRHEEQIDCQSACSAEFEEGTTVELEAKASASSTFVKWTGCDSISEGECLVTMSSAKEVQAEFEGPPPDKELEVVVEPPHSGKVTSTPTGIEHCETTCIAKYGEGVEVTLTEEAASKEFEFEKWEGCDSEPGGDCLVTMNGHRKVKAVFAIAAYPLTVKKEGNGEGTVTSSPPGIDCGGTCSHEYEFGKEVELSQSKEEGSEFVEWGGSCTGADACKVKVEGPLEVTATFKALPQAIVSPTNPIGYTEATLHGKIQTAELETEYRFEYLTEAQFEEEGETFENAQPTLNVNLAASSVPVSVQAHLEGLEEGTAYRFRLVAKSTAGIVEDGGSFETLQRSGSKSCTNGPYRTGFSAGLPDCRAYELVTPAQTNGLSPFASEDGGTPSGSFSNWLTVQRGEGAGELLSYFTSGTLPGFDGNGRRDGYRAERGAGDHPIGGWQSAVFSPDYAQSGGGQPQQHGVTADQRYSIWEVEQAEPLPGALQNGVYLQTPAGFEALGKGGATTDFHALSRYVSPGGTHAIFSSTAQLDPAAPPKENVGLYDHEAGSKGANVLTLPPTSGGSEEEEVEFAAAMRSKEQASYEGASEDGATVAFKAGAVLYARLDDAKTERISPRTARVGGELSCVAGPLFDGEQQLARRHFQWLSNGEPIPGAKGDDVQATTQINHLVKGPDEGAVLQCLTVATEPDPRSIAVSAPVWISPLEPSQAPQPPVQIAAPAPANPTAGAIETCNPGSWERANLFSYQWYDDGEPIPVQRVSLVEVTGGNFKLIATTAKGTGAIEKGSTKVTGLGVTFGDFHVGDAISAAGIPAGTTIVALGTGTLELSQAATEMGTNRSLTAKEATGEIKFDASAGEAEEALEALHAIGENNVSVTSPGAEEFFVNFVGAFGYTDVPLLEGDTSNLTGGAPQVIVSAGAPQAYKVQAADVPGTLQCVVTGENGSATVARASGLRPTSPAPAEPAPVATAQAAPRTTYDGISDDGRYVFFALGDGESPGRLFRFDTQDESTTEIAEAGIFALVSPDGTHAFFSSKEAIGEEANENGEEPEEGAHNLYAWNEGAISFVGTLSPADFVDEAFTDVSHMNLAAWTHSLRVEKLGGRAFAPTRSTPGGGTFVFQSHARLTAYKNEGVGEIYRYDPSAQAGERLVCVSCDPSGSPPASDALLEDIRQEKSSIITPKTMIANLTDDGQKVFFQSFDRLLPADTNEVEDVYEWEAKGVGACGRPGGCLALISSGQSEDPSVLFAMGANGRDVFFETKEKLVGEDVEGSPSIYDAREGGGIPEPQEVPPCQGDACQGQGSQPPVLPSLSSDGPGEEPQGEAPKVRKPCAKGKHRVKGHCVVTKHRHRKRHRRAHHKRGGSR